MCVCTRDACRQKCFEELRSAFGKPKGRCWQAKGRCDSLYIHSIEASDLTQTHTPPNSAEAADERMDRQPDRVRDKVAEQHSLHGWPSGGERGGRGGEYSYTSALGTSTNDRAKASHRIVPHRQLRASSPSAAEQPSHRESSVGESRRARGGQRQLGAVPAGAAGRARSAWGAAEACWAEAPPRGRARAPAAICARKREGTRCTAAGGAGGRAGRGGRAGGTGRAGGRNTVAASLTRGRRSRRAVGAGTGGKPVPGRRASQRHGARRACGASS